MVRLEKLVPGDELFTNVSYAKLDTKETIRHSQANAHVVNHLMVITGAFGSHEFGVAFSAHQCENPAVAGVPLH